MWRRYQTFSYRYNSRFEYVFMVAAVVIFVACCFYLPAKLHIRAGGVLFSWLVISLPVIFGPMTWGIIVVRTKHHKKMAWAMKLTKLDSADKRLIIEKQIPCTFHRIEQTKHYTYDDDKFWDVYAEFPSDEDHMLFLMLRPAKTDALASFTSTSYGSVTSLTPYVNIKVSGAA
jgi:hypothetical protein